MSRWSPRVTVACVVERDGRYLVVEEERGGPATLFNQPAGHLEPDESLLEAVGARFPIDPARRGISGHSMGGHGALTLALRHPNLFRTVSAFAPIVVSRNSVSVRTTTCRTPPSGWRPPTTRCNW